MSTEERSLEQAGMRKLSFDFLSRFLRNSSKFWYYLSVGASHVVHLEC